MTSVRIRPFEPRDADEVVRVHLAAENAALDEWAAGVHMLADPVDAARGWADGPPGGGKALVAEIDGEIVAWVLVSFAADETELEGLYVDPAHWRARIGSTLEHEAEDLMRKEGVATAMLWVMTQHTAARAFYEAHGWIVVPERTRTVTLEDVDLDQIAYVKRLG